jgi:hypothetical protein
MIKRQIPEGAVGSDRVGVEATRTRWVFFLVGFALLFVGLVAAWRLTDSFSCPEKFAVAGDQCVMATQQEGRPAEPIPVVRDDRLGDRVGLVLVAFALGLALAASGAGLARRISGSSSGHPVPQSYKEEWGVVPRIAVLILVAVVALVATIGSYAWGLGRFTKVGAFRPEIVLPALLLSALVGLLMSLAILVAVFRLLGLHNKEGSLGLPEGSVQAVIALSLIMIFAIMAVYLYSTLGADSPRRVRVTRAQLLQMPAEQVLSAPVLLEDPDPEREDEDILAIDRAIPQNTVAQDFAKQIGTTVSTLVVAVAGFYFGSRSVAGAVAAVAGAEKPSLLLLTPADWPHYFSGQEGMILSIKVQARPLNEPLEARIVEGDALGKIRPREGGGPGDFEYVRGPEAADVVTLIIKMVNYPENSLTLTVLKSPDAGGGPEEPKPDAGGGPDEPKPDAGDEAEEPQSDPMAEPADEEKPPKG